MRQLRLQETVAVFAFLKNTSFKRYCFLFHYSIQKLNKLNRKHPPSDCYLYLSHTYYYLYHT